MDIFLVFIPFRGVVLDIFADRIQVCFIPDYMFIIIALPYGYAGHFADFIDAFGRGGFE
jgi:hypothetical protein